MLIMKETFSSSLGAVLCGSDIDATRALIVKWLDEFGFEI